MAKELPYFKFEPAGWKFGRIQKRSKEAKVAFMDLICKYWHDECVMTLEDAKLDFGDDEISELLKYKILKIDDEFIKVDFLDNQMIEIQNTSKKQSEKGKKSAQLRAEKRLPNPTVVETGSTDGQPNSTYKIREDKIRGEEIIKDEIKEDKKVPKPLEGKDQIITELHPLQKYILENYKNISSLKNQLTFPESEKIVAEFENVIIKEILESMENYKDLTKKYVSVNLTIRSWIRLRKEKTQPKPTKLKEYTPGL